MHSPTLPRPHPEFPWHRWSCNPAHCSLRAGCHYWDGSRWWEDGEPYAGLPLPCMHLRGLAAPRVYLPPPLPPARRTELTERARRYVERMPPALAGSGGSTATFRVALALVRGFGFPDDDALAILGEYNARCKPPWSVPELRHKVRQARKSLDVPHGYLLTRRR